MIDQEKRNMNDETRRIIANEAKIHLLEGCIHDLQRDVKRLVESDIKNTERLEHLLRTVTTYKADRRYWQLLGLGVLASLIFVITSVLGLVPAEFLPFFKAILQIVF